MADRSGYIGRNPGDSSVVIARQTFEPTGIQTDFTFASGYTPGYLDVYINGVRLVVASDYTATDGSVVGLTTYADNGDVLECVAYKAFNVNNVDSTPGNFTVGVDLTVGGDLTVDGSLSISGAGASVSYATTSFGLEGSPNITINDLDVDGHTELDDLNVAGVSTFAAAIDANGDLNVAGVSTFVGIVTTSQYFEDSIGKLRSIPQNSKTSSYTAVSSDCGKHISITTGGVTIAVGEFGVGDAFSIYNNSGSTQIITQGAGVTLRYAGSSNTGNRSLLQYGICSVLCVASNEFVISGTGLS